MRMVRALGLAKWRVQHHVRPWELLPLPGAFGVAFWALLGSWPAVASLGSGLPSAPRAVSGNRLRGCGDSHRGLSWSAGYDRRGQEAGTPSRAGRARLGHG